ncbi:MAG: serine hydrolase, partial [Flavobacteriaceae bacterium]|nr:serine hydrolase [Flavobacteriaceae bacterium]
MRVIAIAFYIFLCNSLFSFAQDAGHPLATEDFESQQKWVDSIYNSMSIDEKVGQLFMVQAFSNMDAKHEKAISDLIHKQKIGGIIYSKGGPVRQAKLNNGFQAVSKIPLLVGMDAEWGLSMRLDSTYAFPWNMTLGAIKDNSLVEKAGKHIGEHCKRLGVHFNFAPVVDINTNPNNPIIGNRSFGEDKDNVTQKALAFMKGMQSAGVLANAKHFPGHGDTAQDSHETLPTIEFNKQRLDSVELYPYKALIKEGLSSAMVAHLNVPSLEPISGYPSSISKAIVTDLLKTELGFEGLIFTDALTMKGASDFSNTGDIDLAAFMAGNDVLLMSEDVEIGKSKIIAAVESQVITEARLAHSVKKILMAKYKVGLHKYRPIKLSKLGNELNRLEDDLLYEQLMENAITVVKNETDLLPLRQLEKKKIAYVKLGDDDGEIFFNELQKYGKVHQITAQNLDELITKLKNYNTVIIGFHKSNANPWKGYKFSNQELVWLYEIARTNNVILNVFAKPYSLLDLESTENIESIMVSYQNSKIGQKKAAQLIFGGIPANGVLPVSIGNSFNAGDGISFSTLSRLSYGLPERVGMSSKRLSKIDSVAQYAVDAQMTPGIQLLVARKGKVIYNKNFGKHTYEGSEIVKTTDVYDVASLTKILATLPLLMELEENEVVDLDEGLSQILPEYKDSNKEQVTIKKMLSHYARLKPWIPFYINTLDSTTRKPDKKYYRKERSKDFNIEVTNSLFLRTDYQDSIQKIIKESETLNRLRYRYSDLPYYILKKYIETNYGKGLDVIVQEHLYQSLGANYTTYNPRNVFSKTQIIPTEIDDYFRYEKVHGYVHDMGTAMQNGVGGHAGVFSNANDVAKIMQLY